MKTLLKKIFRFLPTWQKKPAHLSLEDTTDQVAEEQVVWWGTFGVEEEQSRYFKIGSLVLCADRFNHKWHITTYREGEKPFKTFAAQTTNEITLKPALPDRSLLSPLDRPFYIPTGETLLLYISSPLWIQIAAGSPPILLDEFATEILADTWFGKNTLEGELCYANQTYCSTALSDLPRDTTRVITPIYIENRSPETLLLQELKVPFPFLSIYSDSQNHLWTEQLNISQAAPNNIDTTVIKGPSKLLKNIQLISPPRLILKPGLKNLFSSFMWK